MISMIKKLLIFGILIAVAALGGCEASTNQLLNFQDMEAAFHFHMDNKITVGHFFAENLAVITDEENHGNDTQLISEASLLVNVSNREILYANNAYEKLFPASLTKLMTALIVLQRAELTDYVTISKEASHIMEPGAKLCGFEEGDVISMEALLNCLLIYSGNDAGVAIAQHLGGSLEGFARLMNNEAKKIGAVHSNFVNPHGLHDENHYTTAYDLYLIFNELIKYDMFCSVIDTASYTASYKDREGNEKQKIFQTTNRYLTGKADTGNDITVIGGKTGTTSKAGNCLILYCKDKNDKEYISLILKASGGDQLYFQMSHLLSLIQK
jgi:D-alanyl-D-alanine carboxypeptidase (penicillin-binding protein 5/6)